MLKARREAVGFDVLPASEKSLHRPWIKEATSIASARLSREVESGKHQGSRDHAAHLIEIADLPLSAIDRTAPLAMVPSTDAAMDVVSRAISLSRESEVYSPSPSHNPKPFVWTAEPEKVLAAVKRGKQALESIH